MPPALDASILPFAMVPQTRTPTGILSELDDIDALVALYWARVLRYVTFSINDADLANTITQDTFLKAYRNRATFRGECAISTWLIGIANNLVRDQLRLRKFQFWRKAGQTSIDVTEMAGVLPSQESSAERRVLARERAAQVGEAMQQLSPNQRRIFQMRFYEDMDLGEIAASLNMPVNTVKTHLHRGASAVRKAMEAR